MNLINATWTTTTFCRKCKKLRSCLDTHNVSEYRFLCKECAGENDLVGTCRSCGREGISRELNKQGGYCWSCYNDNIIECSLCGNEVYNHTLNDGACKKCVSGVNKACIKCGTYISSKNLSTDGLCDKCSIQIHKNLRESEVNEVVECIECGREQLVNHLEEGLCMFCYKNDEIKKLKNDIKRVKRKVYN